LIRNDVVQERIESGKLLVVGAFYEMSSGIVDFYSPDENDSMCGQCVTAPPAS
jgi:hypothetical protein